MTDSASPESPLDVATGAVGSNATAAFSLLANETRLAILLALWVAYEPHGERKGVSFSELRDHVGVRDSGQFNYHLSQLEDRFIRKTEAGYELRPSGLMLVQSIIAGIGIDDPTFEPVEIDARCTVCGALTFITYDNVYVYQICPECADDDDPGDWHPPGTRVGWTFEPTGLSNRTAEELFAASTIKNFGRIAMRFEGLCPDCSGPVEWSIDICEAHEPAPGEDCPNCGRADAVMARETCTVCKSSGYGSPSIKVLFHPAVIAFYYQHGIELGFTGDTTYDDVVRILALVDGFEEELVSVDPLRLRVTVSHEQDELELLLDGTMRVIEVGEPN